MRKGELVFDGVAISDTSATVRRPRRRTPVGPSGCVPRNGLRYEDILRQSPGLVDPRRVQSDGGAVYMLDGNITFRGSSTITRTRAVRPALPNAHMYARTCSY